MQWHYALTVSALKIHRTILHSSLRILVHDRACSQFWFDFVVQFSRIVPEYMITVAARFDLALL